MARMKVEYEPLNGIQPWAVYKIAGREKQHCASFSTKQKAVDWVKKYGHRNINH